MKLTAPTARLLGISRLGLGRDPLLDPQMFGQDRVRVVQHIGARRGDLLRREVVDDADPRLGHGRVEEVR